MSLMYHLISFVCLAWYLDAALGQVQRYYILRCRFRLFFFVPAMLYFLWFLIYLSIVLLVPQSS
jgi:hypothetical protein